MAMTTGLPPQAYTRDVLVQAFEWWSTQPQALKERATSADAIVSYYLQARRRGPVNSEAPLSGEAFKADLKNLAEGLRQFEDTIAPPPPLKPQAPIPPAAAPAMPAHTPHVVVWSVDARSLQAAKEIQNRLNLGSEIEALRMLVTLGVERSRDLFP